MLLPLIVIKHSKLVTLKPCYQSHLFGSEQGVLPKGSYMGWWGKLIRNCMCSLHNIKLIACLHQQARGCSNHARHVVDMPQFQDQEWCDAFANFRLDFHRWPQHESCWKTPLRCYSWKVQAEMDASPGDSSPAGNNWATRCSIFGVQEASVVCNPSSVTTRTG